MAGKNEKIDFLNDIGAMVNSQKEENQMLRRKKDVVEPIQTDTDRVGQSSASTENSEHKSFGRGRPKVVRRVERKKTMTVFFDLPTHKALGRIKLEHNFDMKDVAYIAIRKFLDEYMDGNMLSDKGIALIEKRLEELNGF